MHTRHVKATFNKIVDVDGQLESLQPVVQRVIVSHLENETQRNKEPAQVNSRPLGTRRKKVLKYP